MLHAIVVDDESAALKWFERVASTHEELSVDGVLLYAEDALAFVKKNAVDVAFLDIEMPQLSGLELAELLMDADPYIKVIFVTAYNQYALDAFRTHAIGYLLKPLDSDELSEQLKLLIDWHRQKPEHNSVRHLSVKCFGQFAVSSDDGTTIRWKTLKAEELFALLVHHQGRIKAKDILIDALWPDVEPAKSINLFRVTCTYLRTALGELGFHDLILRKLDGYWINTDNIDCDLYHFRAAVHHVAPNDIKGLETATALYHGEYLEGKAFDWAINARTQTEADFKKLQHILAGVYLSISLPGKACEAMDKILLHDPCDETAISRVIQLKLESGKAAEAMIAYKRYEKSLQAELGIEPSMEMKQLFDK
jgi:two-component system, LytTR family, response regulator